MGLESLTKLCLADNWMTHLSALALAPILKRMKQLTHLDLFANKLGDAGVLALVPALKELRTLKHLDLVYNELSHKSARALAPLLSFMDVESIHVLFMQNSDQNVWRWNIYQAPLRHSFLAFLVVSERTVLGSDDGDMAIRRRVLKWLILE